jgi:hypothetical protein
MQQGFFRTISARARAITKLPSREGKTLLFLSTPAAYERYQQIR